MFGNKKIISYMRALAVFSALSISIFSYSYNIVLANYQIESTYTSYTSTEKSIGEKVSDHSDYSSNDTEKLDEENVNSDHNRDHKEDSDDKDDDSNENHVDVGDHSNPFVPHDHSSLVLLGVCNVNDYSTNESVYGKEGATFSAEGHCAPPEGTTLSHVSIVMDDGGKVYVGGERVYSVDNSCGIKYKDIDLPLPVEKTFPVSWTAINCGLAGVGARVEFKFYGEKTVVNCPPTLTLLGDSTMTITQGDTFVDPGATANDKEDGDITSRIVKTSNVDVNTPGIYTITYNVKDSKGAEATPVSRTVVVLEKVLENKGKITFCLILADSQNVIATTSTYLPQGEFKISLSTTTSRELSTQIAEKIWNTNTFNPNKKIILNQNDADCVVYDNLEYGSYRYSTLSLNGSSWSTPMYNDQNDQPINNVFDFFQFGDTNTNSDGVINIGPERKERVLGIYQRQKDVPACFLPEITSAFEANGVVNKDFSFNLTASSTEVVSWEIATTTLPAGLSFSTTTNSITGRSTVVGQFSVSVKAINNCGYDDGVLVIKIADDTIGGGGSTPTANLSLLKTSDKSSANAGDQVKYTLKIENKGPNDATNVKVTDLLPSTLDFVSASTSIGSYATSTGIWTIGNLSNGSTTELTLVANIKSGTAGQKISNTATAASDVADNDSSNNTSVAEINVNLPTNTGGGNSGGGGNGGGGAVGSGTPTANGPIAGSYGGGGGGIITSPVQVSTSTPVKACTYLEDYLRKDFNNNPVEVTKLQTFLRDFEGFVNIKVTGVYDDATIDAVNVFQMRYKDDVLTPWGHTAPTGYVYILTKKKVNEIYCQKMFPVTVDQQKEIDTHRNALLNATSTVFSGGPVGISYGNSSSAQNTGTKGVGTTSSIKDNAGNLANLGMTTLAGLSSTTKNITSDFVANVISSGKRLGSLATALFVWPLKKISSYSPADNICSLKSSVYGWSNLLLIIVIIIISYLWYREYRNNRKIEEINKEIDLQ